MRLATNHLSFSVVSIYPETHIYGLALTRREVLENARTSPNVLLPGKYQYGLFKFCSCNCIKNVYVCVHVCVSVCIHVCVQACVFMHVCAVS